VLTAAENQVNLNFIRRRAAGIFMSLSDVFGRRERVDRKAEFGEWP
jgi:hypothetical protein